MKHCHIRQGVGGIGTSWRTPQHSHIFFFIFFCFTPTFTPTLQKYWYINYSRLGAFTLTFTLTLPYTANKIFLHHIILLLIVYGMFYGMFTWYFTREPQKNTYNGSNDGSTNNTDNTDTALQDIRTERPKVCCFPKKRQHYKNRLIYISVMPIFQCFTTSVRSFSM